MSWFRMLLVTAFVCQAALARDARQPLFFVKAPAKNKAERQRIADSGVAIDGVLSDSVAFVGTRHEIDKLQAMGIPLEINALDKESLGFPSADSAYHDHAETLAALDKIVADHPDIATRITAGKSLEGRELAGVRLSSVPQADTLPTAVFMGCHHAREHLSVEVPLMLAQYLADHYKTDPRIHELLDTREVWIVPMVNPDGAEFDIKSGHYQMWRKNRRSNNGDSYGVDLNRNYGGPNWGGPGASGDQDDETYHGPSAFSEPETRAVRDFVVARKKTTVLLTYHTFSELILWPWGYTNDAISNATDRKVFETMGNKMATWNHYTAEKSSELYLTTGDTTDWAYAERKIFAFTFELTPSSMFAGGFYPGAKAIQPTFDANLEPALYLIQNAINPYDAVSEEMVDPLAR